MHAAGDRAPQQAPHRIGRLAQQRQFLAEFIEQTGKTLYRCAISRTDVASLPRASTIRSIGPSCR